jgi:hypothetical protein
MLSIRTFITDIYFVLDNNFKKLYFFIYLINYLHLLYLLYFKNNLKQLFTSQSMGNFCGVKDFFQHLLE